MVTAKARFKALDQAIRWFEEGCISTPESVPPLPSIIAKWNDIKDKAEWLPKLNIELKSPDELVVPLVSDPSSRKELSRPCLENKDDNAQLCAICTRIDRLNQLLRIARCMQRYRSPSALLHLLVSLYETFLEISFINTMMHPDAFTFERVSQNEILQSYGNFSSVDFAKTCLMQSQPKKIQSEGAEQEKCPNKEACENWWTNLMTLCKGQHLYMTQIIEKIGATIKALIAVPCAAASSPSSSFTIPIEIRKQIPELQKMLRYFWELDMDSPYSECSNQIHYLELLGNRPLKRSCKRFREICNRLGMDSWRVSEEHLKNMIDALPWEEDNGEDEDDDRMFFGKQFQ